MNERIQELYKRAMVTVPANPGNKEFTWFDPEKFAELIVKECCQFEKVYSGDAGLVARHFSRKIKRHFGVEE